MSVFRAAHAIVRRITTPVHTMQMPFLQRFIHRSTSLRRVLTAIIIRWLGHLTLHVNQMATSGVSTKHFTKRALHAIKLSSHPSLLLQHPERIHTPSVHYLFYQLCDRPQNNKKLHI